MKNFYVFFVILLAFCTTSTFAASVPEGGEPQKATTSLTILTNSTSLTLEDDFESLVLGFKHMRTDEVNICVYNQKRRCMYRNRYCSIPGGTQLHIDYMDWPKGEYLVLIKQGSGKSIKSKLVIE